MREQMKDMHGIFYNSEQVICKHKSQLKIKAAGASTTYQDVKNNLLCGPDLPLC